MSIVEKGPVFQRYMPSRRRVIQSAGAVAALAAYPKAFKVQMRPDPLAH